MVIHFFPWDLNWILNIIYTNIELQEVNRCFMRWEAELRILCGNVEPFSGHVTSNRQIETKLKCEIRIHTTQDWWVKWGTEWQLMYISFNKFEIEAAHSSVKFVTVYRIRRPHNREDRNSNLKMETTCVYSCETFVTSYQISKSWPGILYFILKMEAKNFSETLIRFHGVKNQKITLLFWRWKYKLPPER
jgi:hypothetical protein